MALSPNHLRLAKESRTSELLKPTLLNKSICTKDIAEGEKYIQTLFRHFQEVIYLSEQRLRAQRSRQVNLECRKGGNRACTIHVGKNNIKEKKSQFLMSIPTFFFNPGETKCKNLFSCFLKVQGVLLAKLKERMVIQVA